MPLLNATALKTHWNILTWPPHKLALSCLVKGRYALVQNGEAILHDEQVLPSGPMFHEDDATQFPLMASEFGPAKPKVDVLLQGSCHLQKEQGEALVSVEIDGWKKELLISGERNWQKKLLGWKYTSAKPFSQCPLQWDLAYGAAEFPANNWGIGALAEEGAPLPRIEYASRRISSPKDVITPAGFGPVPIQHPRRVEELGTFDDAWVNDIWPQMPQDFNPAAANHAPLDQQLDELPERFTLRLHNLHKDAEQFVCVCQLDKPQWLYKADAQVSYFTQAELKVDTISIYPDEGYVDVIWRAIIPIADEREAAQFEHYIVPELGSKTLEQFHDDWLAQQDQDEELLQRREEIVAAATVLSQQVQSEKSELALDSREAVQKALDDDEDLSAQEFNNLDLAGIDFSDRIMAAAKFYNCNLKGAKFNRAILSSVDFFEVDASDAEFSEAELHCAKFHAVQLHAAQCEGADFSVCEFNEVTAQSIQAQDAIFFASKAQNFDLYQAHLQGADLSQVHWQKLQADEANAEGALANGAQFIESSWKAAKLEKFGGNKVQAEKSDFSAAALGNSVWEGASLKSCTFRATDLSSTIFNYADLSGSDFTLCLAQKTCFRYAHLAQTVFNDADLKQADCWGADLEGAQADGANTYEICLAEAQNIPVGFVQVQEA